MSEELKYSGDIYDKTAPFLNPAYASAHEAQNAALLKALESFEEPIVFDLGCGTAFDGERLLTENPNLFYVGVDKSTDILEFAGEKLDRFGSRVKLIEGDILNLGTSDQLKELYNKAQMERAPSGIITAYTFHHFSPKEKANLYAASYALLDEEGVFINTDLFCPLDRNLFEESLNIEIENLKNGADQIPEDYLTEDIRARLVDEWVSHYRTKNRPTALEEDVEALNQAGFLETNQLFHQFQSRCIAAASPSEINAASYHQILGFLYEALGSIPEDSSESERDIAYARLFEDNDSLRKSAYAYFGLSGASFVISDNRASKFVMLKQLGATVVEGENGGDPGQTPPFAMPIYEAPSAFTAFESFEWTDGEYNQFINHIFQIQRDHQGLRNYGEKLTLTHEPEFLMRLPSGFMDGQNSEARTYCVDDCFECPSELLVRQIIVWRWLIWLVTRYGENITLGEKPFGEFYEGRDPKTAPVDRYFSEEFFEAFDYFKRDVSPEGAINRLDDESAWLHIGGDQSFAKWDRVREKLDQFDKASFGEDIEPIVSVFFGETGDELKERTARMARECHEFLLDECDKNVPITDVLSLFHGRTPSHPVEALAPACAYFYYIAIDGRPKSHVIIGLLRSMQSPLEYYVGEQRKLHSAVVIGLATLNGSEGETRRQYKLLQLRTFLRACTDPLVDRIFIKSLKEAEQSSAAIEAEKVLEVSRYSKISGVYILGSFDHRITFYSQQSRALMLARALHKKGLLDSERHAPEPGPVEIGVVGGGLSGVTAAAAFAVLGCKVTILEERARLLDLQSQASHRYIHPRIAEWPEENSLRTDAQLPLLNWQARDAQSVLGKVSGEFEKVSELVLHRPTELSKKRVREIKKEDKRVAVLFENVPEDEEDKVVEGKLDFDFVVVAVGFGLDGERTVELKDNAGNTNKAAFDDNRPYWTKDNLGDPQEIGDDAPKSVLIVGSGDGALIDLARVAIKPSDSQGRRSDADLMHGEMVERLAGDPLIRKLGVEFRNADERLRREQLRDGRISSDLFAVYDEIFTDFSEVDALREAVSSIGVERSWKVYFSPGGRVFGFNSLLFSRLVAFLLIKFDYVEMLSNGKVVNSTVRTVDGRVTREVSFADESKRRFDIVIGRFGPPKENDVPGVDRAKMLPRNVRIVGQIAGLEDASSELGGRLADLEVASHLDRSTFNWFSERMRELEGQYDGGAEDQLVHAISE